MYKNIQRMLLKNGLTYNSYFGFVIVSEKKLLQSFNKVINNIRKKNKKLKGRK